MVLHYSRMNLKYHLNNYLPIQYRIVVWLLWITKHIVSKFLDISGVQTLHAYMHAGTRPKAVLDNRYYYYSMHIVY